MPQERTYDAVVFDLLTALIDPWTLLEPRGWVGRAA